MADLDKMTRRFLLGESTQQVASVESQIQGLEETLTLLTPRSQSDTRRVEIARAHLREIKRHLKRLQQENASLQQKIESLEDDNANAKIEEDYK